MCPKPGHGHKNRPSEARRASCTGESAWTTHTAKSTQHVRQRTAFHLFHHLLHLLVLLEQTVQILDLGTGALADTALARTVEHIRVLALTRSHGVDDGFHTTELTVIHFGSCCRRQHAHAGHLVQDAGHTTHVFHLLQLLAEVFKVKALALLQFAGQFGSLFLVYL